MVSAVDITAEIEIQNKLIETNSRLQLASELANLGYWTNDLTKSKIVWTDEIYKIFEVDPQDFELTMDNIQTYFHPEDRMYFDPEVFYNLDEKKIFENELRITTDSGKIKWIFVRIHLIRDNDGNPIQLEGIVLDITKRKMHEQEILESNERFKTLTKATVEAIVDWDVINNKVFWGEGFNTIFGYDISNSDNYLWVKNIHPDDSQKILDDLNRAIKNPTKEYFNAEYRFLKANHEIAYVQHKGILIRNCDGKVTRIIAAMIDLTEALEKMNKIELQDKALKDISWTQSHVVRAPLANLLGLIHLLKDNRELGVNDDKLVDYISESAEKLDHIIHNIVQKTNETNP
ncbi:MAG: PAS domain-containing protein [Bacteroidia bacterium]